ncbi:MAG: EAL domain-containing protein [Potamolinea sp.]
MRSQKKLPNIISQQAAARFRSAISSLRFRLILLVLFAVFPALGMILYTDFEERKKESARVRQEALSITTTVSKSQAQSIEGVRQLLVTLSKLPQVRSSNSLECSRFLADLRDEYPLYANLGVVELDGKVRCSAVSFSESVNLSDLIWFQRALKNSYFSVGDYQIGRITGKPSINFSYPIHDERGRVQAIVYAALDLTWFNQLTTAAHLSPDAAFTIIDGKGTILARYPNPETWVGKEAPEAPIVKTILRQQKEGTVEARGLDGVLRLYAFAPLSGVPEGSNIYVSVGIPRAIAYAEADQRLMYNLIWFGLISAASLIAAWMGTDLFVLRQVKALLKATQQLADGNLNIRTGLPYNHGELSQLAQGFDRMAASLQESQETLQQSQQTLQQKEKQYRLVVNNLREVVFQTDVNGLWKFLNPAWTEITGFKLEESIGTNFLDYVPPDDRQTNLEEFQTLIERKKDFCRHEVRYLTQDGTYRWLEVHAQIMLAADATILGTSGTLNDITERKSIEAERELLVKQLRREREDLAALSTVTANAISTLNLEELLNLLLQRIVQVMHADAAVILLTENGHPPPSQVLSTPSLSTQDSALSTILLRPRASFGVNEEIHSNFVIPIGQGFAGKIAATMKPLYLEDAQTDPLIVSPIIKQRGIRTMLGVPLKRDGVLVGVLHVDWCHIHQMGDSTSTGEANRELQLLEITAERCTMAILNAQLYEKSLHLQERLQLQLDSMPIACILTDEELSAIDWNPAAEKIFGFTKEEVLGKKPCELITPPAVRPQVQEIFRLLTAGETTAHSVNKNLTKDGRTIVCEWHNTPLKAVDGSVAGMLSIAQDITDRQQVEKQLWRYAYYEPLTGLPNRTLFLERIQEQIEAVKSGETGLFAVLLLELERFEVIKYSLGHSVADELMIATAQRLEKCLRPKDTVAQLRSDEFAILLADLQNCDEVLDMADWIYQRLMLPFELNGREVFSTTSIGIVQGGCEELENSNLASYDRPEDFLRAADTAKYYAKMQPNTRHALFHPAMHEQAVARFQLETDLRVAIERQQFQVYYQPIVSLKTGKITGFEALVRWNHPTRGMVSPVEFIPLAEETGVISLIDWWVLREACVQLNVWQKRFTFLEPLTMSVNLSGLQLVQLSLVERLDKILRETGVNGSSLKLEITETGLLKNANSGTVMLKQLKTLGVKLSIDDFGTGHSSLARLHQLPIDTLKIDRSFVSRIGFEDDGLEIVRTIITLAHSLDMDVIAEGIETPQQQKQLRLLQCEYGQGYFFSKPVDKQAAEKLLIQQFQFNHLGNG